MVVGETLMVLQGSPYYTPQFNRAGNSAVFPVELLQIAGGLTLALVIDVETKNSSDTTWSSLTTFATSTPSVFIGLVNGGIKEQVRFKIQLQGGSAATDAAHFMILAPQWQPY